MVKNIYKLIFIVLLLGMWETIVQLEIYPVALMPSLSAIIEVFIDEKSQILFSVLNSLSMIIKGLTIACVLAIFLVWISQKHEMFDTWVDLMINVMHPIPGVALLPLVILWFGIGEKAILFILVHAALWPLLVNLKLEMKRLKKSYTPVIQSFKIDLKTRIKKIYLPGCSPGIISGLNIGWNRSWRGFISAEMIFGIVGQKSGIGWYIFEKRVYCDTAGLFAGLIAIVICSLLIETFVFSYLEKKTVKKWAI